MKIVDVVFAPCSGGFYNDDQKAIKSGGRRDGFFHIGGPLTPGFDSIRMPASALSIGLVLSDGRVAWGDIMTVQYSGVSGREARFDASTLAAELENTLTSLLVGQDIQSFRDLNTVLSAGNRHRPSVMYGATQALLSAVALTQNRSIAEVICSEYNFPLLLTHVPIFSQCGEARYENVDKMIIKEIEILPHGLLNSPELFGKGGIDFRKYALWVKDRIKQHAHSDYHPVLHFDLYGGLGDALDNDIDAVADFLQDIEQELQPFTLQVEAVADFGGRDEQIAGMAAIRKELRNRGCSVRLVADEWCNTLADIEAFSEARAADIIQLKMPDIGSLDEIIRGVQACKRSATGVYLGGSCAETDLSARISVHVAVATQADMQLAKPGMGVDEGYMIVANEQFRLLALLESQRLPAQPKDVVDGTSGIQHAG